jgi:error-prone DNA polymerase
MISERTQSPFKSMDDFKARTEFNKDELRALADIGALNCFAPHRRAALWETEKTMRREELFTAPAVSTESLVTAQAASPRPESWDSPLAPMNAVERLQADYAGLRLTTGPHPMALVRARMPDVWRSRDLARAENGDFVRVAGQVICRQRPGTAKGVCFISLEDETGITNVIVWPQLFETERLKIVMEPFLLVVGQVQAREGTIHVVARSIERLDFSGLQTAASHDFG